MYQFDIEKIQEYFRTLAVRHKDLLHGDNNAVFARFHLDEEVQALVNNASKNVVVVGDVSGRRVGHKDDYMLQREIVLRFACLADMNGNIDAARAAAMSKAEAIMMDWMSEIERQQELDMNGEDGCGLMHYLQPEAFSWEEIEDQPWLVHHYGWDLTVPFRVHTQAHDASKWNP